MSSLHDLLESFPSSALDATEGTNFSSISPTSPSWVWRQISWEWWVILQMATALLGIAGNLLVVTLLFQRRKKSRSTDLLVGALATADLFTSIFMIPLPSADRVPLTSLGEIYCRLVFSSILIWISIVASIFTLTIIPLERYLAIVYPFRFKEIFSRKNVRIVIVFIWFLGIMINLPVAIITIVSPSTEQCSVAYPGRQMQIVWGSVLFVSEFLLPALVSLILQVLTARALHHQSLLHLNAHQRLDRTNPSVRHLIAKRRVVRMLFTVVLIFIICWGPTQICYFSYHLGLIPDSYLYSPLYRAVNVLALYNSCVNPIVYTLSYPEFRKAVKELFAPSKQNMTPLFDEKLGQIDIDKTDTSKNKC